jgi:uncharacterized protein
MLEHDECPPHLNQNGHLMSKRLRVFVSLLLLPLFCAAANAQKIPYAPDEIAAPTEEWAAKVEAAAPAKATVEAEKRRLLVFSLHTGYWHNVIPHVDKMLVILGTKSGAFETTVTYDIEDLAPESLAKYDVLVLNNNCSKGPRRNLFLDELERNPKYAELSAEERQAKSDALEKSMLEFVAGGKGLVGLHGSPTFLNNSAAFTGMIGGAFDYHPPNQEVTIRTVDETHPLVAAFRGQGPFIHRDEPYCFNGAYEKLDFRPLLSMDIAGLRDPKGQVGKLPRYVSWIRAHGKGRVFYCSPSHFPTTYESSTMLRFISDGIQYAAGDLECDDSVPAKKK